MDRVLVTGGTGFTGSHLTRALAGSGSQVRVLARSAARARQVLPPSVEIVEGDVTDPQSVRRAVRGRDVVYHLATVYREAGLRDSEHRAVHVDGTMLLLEAARAESVRSFVHCSTVGVLGHIRNPPADERTPHSPGDIYQRTKSEAETAALEFQRRHDFPLTVARPTAIYGPGDMRLLKLFRMIARRRFIILGDGRIYYHMVHVDDLVRGLRLLATRSAAIGQVFILGGEECRTLNEIAALVARLLHVPAPRLRVPAAPFQWLGSACEAVCVPLGIEPPIHRRRVDFFTKSRSFSIEKARSLLDYRPLVPLESGLAATAEWYRAHGHLPSLPARHV